MGNLPLVTYLGSTLTNAIQTTLGAGNSRQMRLTTNTTVSENPLNVHSNKTVDAERGGKLVKSGSGKINFAGLGVYNPLALVAHFSGFGVADIGFTGLVYPPKISPELWDTSDDSLSKRLDRADKAFAHTVTVATGGAAVNATSVPVSALPTDMPSGTILTFTGGKTATLTADALKDAVSLAVQSLPAALIAGDTARYSKTVEIHASPRTIDDYVFFEPNRTVVFANGKFKNTNNLATLDDQASSDYALRRYSEAIPFCHRSNNHFKGSGDTRIYQGSIDEKIGLFYPAYIFNQYENVTWENLDFYYGGGRSTSGKRAVIDTGNVRGGYIKYCNFYGVQGYAISVVGAANATTLPFNYAPQDFVVERNFALDTWAQTFNIIFGRRIRFFNNVIKLEKPPEAVGTITLTAQANASAETLAVQALTEAAPVGSDITFSTGETARVVSPGAGVSATNIPVAPLASTIPTGRKATYTIASIGAAYDIEANTGDELLEEITFDGNELHFLYRGLSPSYINVFEIQGVDAGIREFDFVNNKVYSPLQSIGVRYPLTAYGVQGFRIKHNYLSGGSEWGAALRACRNVQMMSNEIVDCQRAVSIEACADLIYTDNDTRTCVSNKIVETETFYPVIANGTTVMAARLFGTNDSTRDSPHRHRFYSHFEGLEINLQNANTEITSVYIPSNFGTDSYKKLTTAANHGTKAGKTFTSANITGNNITITAHGFKRGEPVLFTTAGTFPTITNRHERMHVIVIDANTVQLASSLANALDETEETISAGGSGTHTLTPFQLTVHSVLPAAVNTTTNEITFEQNHNFVDNAFIEYDNYDGTKAAGLYRHLEHDGSINRSGVYKVDVVSATVIKLIEIEGASSGTEANITTQGTGFHLFTPVAETRFSNNQYNLEADTEIELHSGSRSKIYRRFKLDETLMTGFVEGTGGTPTESDTIGAFLSKVKNWLVAITPISTYKLDLLETSLWGSYGIKRLHQLYVGKLFTLERADGSQLEVMIDPDTGDYDTAAVDAFDADPRVVKWWSQSSDKHLTASYADAPILDTATNSLRFDDKALTIPSMAGLTSASVFLNYKLDSDPPSGGGGDGGIWTLSSGDTYVPFGDGTVYDSTFSTTRQDMVNPTDAFTSYGWYSVYSATNAWSARWNAQSLGTNGSNVFQVPSAPKLGRNAAGANELIGNVKYFVITSSVASTQDRTDIHAGL
jgi:hypothetical protein